MDWAVVPGSENVVEFWDMDSIKAMAGGVSGRGLDREMFFFVVFWGQDVFLWPTWPQRLQVGGRRSRVFRRFGEVASGELTSARGLDITVGHVFLL